MHDDNMVKKIAGERTGQEVVNTELLKKERKGCHERIIERYVGNKAGNMKQHRSQHCKARSMFVGVIY